MNFAIWKRLIRTPYGIAVGLGILMIGMLLSAGSPLTPIVITTQVGMDKSQVTIFFLIGTLIATVVTLISGYLSDGTVARYKLAAVGGTVAAVGYLGLATATLPIHAFIAGAAMYVIVVIFPQIFAMARLVVVGGWTREDQVMGITALRTLFSLGFIIGTTLASFLAKANNIQSLFYIGAPVALAVTLYSTILLYRMERHVTRHTVAPTAHVATSEAAKPQVITLPFYALIGPLIALTILEGADSTRSNFLPLIMYSSFKDASIAPIMFGISAAAELITMSLIGNVAGKIGAKNTIFWCTLVAAVYYVIHAFVQSLPVLYAIQPFYAIYVAALQGVAMAYLQGLLAHRTGMGGSLHMAVMNIGSLLGTLSPLLVPGYSPTIFVVPAILCVIGALLMRFTDHTAQIEQRLRESMSQSPPLALADADGK